MGEDHHTKDIQQAKVVGKGREAYKFRTTLRKPGKPNTSHGREKLSEVSAKLSWKVSLIKVREDREDHSSLKVGKCAKCSCSPSNRSRTLQPR